MCYNLIMKKLIISLILIFLLSGCEIGVYNLEFFTLPDDSEFMQVVESLNTPDKICCYIKDNFTPMVFNEAVFDPYTMWQVKSGDCNDYSTFAIFCAAYHGYEVYQILLIFPEGSHMIAVYKVDEGYLFSDLCYLQEEIYNSFGEIMKVRGCDNYRIYDYDMNLITSQ